jgi:adenosylmethionine-8-amino-7-oxononanoate aminotransferase
MTPEELLALDRAHVWHPYASATDPLPVVPVVATKGTRLVLADGRELVDGMSSWWAAIHGYGHPALLAALHAQADRMAHVMFGGLTHEPAVALSELLVRITPPGLNRVFLSDSGSVAVEVALKMALQHWQGRGQERSLFITVRGGYHGDTTGAMSVTDPVNGMHTMFRGWLPQQVFADRPRPRFDEECTEADLAEIAALLRAHGPATAAIIIEPVVQGAGGMWFYAPAFLRRVRELCDEHDVLLIADEIATGFGRTGRLFACEHAGVTPDILCVGKALTGGALSLAATLCTDEVAGAVSAAPSGAFMHGPTFMGNPLATAVARASIELLLSRDWATEVAAIETQLRDALTPLATLSGVADVRVLGAIGVVELREPVDMRVVQPRFVELGAWLRPFGRLVYAMPPFVSTTDDIATITQAMSTVVSEIAA